MYSSQRGRIVVDKNFPLTKKLNLVPRVNQPSTRLLFSFNYALIEARVGNDIACTSTEY